LGPWKFQGGRREDEDLWGICEKTGALDYHTSGGNWGIVLFQKGEGDKNQLDEEFVKRGSSGGMTREAISLTGRKNT